MSVGVGTAPRSRVHGDSDPICSAAWARVDLAAVLGARDRLASIAAGDGMLLHTAGLGHGDPAVLLRRAAEAALMLAYARGGPVTNLNSPARPNAQHLLADATAYGRPLAPTQLVDELVRVLPGGPVRDRVLTPMWRAIRFAEMYHLQPAPVGMPLMCAEPGGRERPVPGGTGCYDPAAHVLRVAPTWAERGWRAPAGRVEPAHAERFVHLVNPLLVDVTGEDPDQMPGLCDRLDPGQHPGRLVLRVSGGQLSASIAALAGTAHRVIWLVPADDAGRRAAGVCLGTPDRDEGLWMLHRAARLAVAMLS